MVCRVVRFIPRGARPYLFEHSQKQTTEHINQQYIHQVGEEDGMFKIHRPAIEFEVVVEYSHPEGMSVGIGQFSLHRANNYQQEPSEGKAAVHIAQQEVLLGYPPVQQALTYCLPNGGQKTPGPDIFADDGSLKFVETPYPAPILPDRDVKEEKHPHKKWKYKD